MKSTHLFNKYNKKLQKLSSINFSKERRIKIERSIEIRDLKNIALIRTEGFKEAIEHGLELILEDIVEEAKTKYVDKHIKIQFEPLEFNMDHSVKYLDKEDRNSKVLTCQVVATAFIGA